MTKLKTINDKKEERPHEFINSIIQKIRKKFNIEPTVEFYNQDREIRISIDISGTKETYILRSRGNFSEWEIDSETTSNFISKTEDPLSFSSNNINKLYGAFQERLDKEMRARAKRINELEKEVESLKKHLD